MTKTPLTIGCVLVVSRSLANCGRTVEDSSKGVK